MNEFEIYQSLTLNLEALNDQFEFWMTVTFAVVVASYTAGNRLIISMRVIISALYILSVVMFYIRYDGIVSASGAFVGRLLEMGYTEDMLPMGKAWLASRLRIFIVFAGTLMAVLLICLPNISVQLKKEKNPG